MKYLVLQIGCIECGVSSYPIKTFENLEDAKKCRDEHPSTWDSEGGDGRIAIYDLVECKEIG